VSDVALVAVPSAVVMVIFAVTAPAGIVNRSSVCVELVTVAVTVPTLTTGSLRSRRLVPVTITSAPTAPLAGVKLMILGSTLKLALLIPVAIGWSR
jgi:hypothetical protein